MISIDPPPQTSTLCPPPPRFLFNQSPPSTDLAVSVIVPVRDEAHHLTQTLDALRQQRDEFGNSLSFGQYEVLLLLNNCTDDSFAVACRYQACFSQFSLHLAQISLPPEQANIGTVRRLLMDEAYRRLQINGNQAGIIASTDGDTVVDSHWLYYIMQEIARGNDAVGGRILTRPDKTTVRRNYLRDVMYRTLTAQLEARLDPQPNDPWPRHFQHFGASLAVTCAMYEQAGRLPVVPHLEDEAFYRALLRTDAKIRKSPLVKVTTSTRMQGRVAVGFSEQLRCWQTMNQNRQCQVAEPAQAIVIRLRNRHRLRNCWQSEYRAIRDYEIESIARELCLDAHWLRAELSQAPYFGQLWGKIEGLLSSGQWAKTWTPVPITEAIRELRALLSQSSQK